MNQYRLNPARLMVVVVFALSCFGILLYLWSTFGGPMPLRPAGYRVTVGLPESDLLTANADVRISGVSVGKVVRTERVSDDPNRKDAVIELESDYAPLPSDARAMIRRKSIGGEMYVELTPGTRTGPKLADGGRLPHANVGESVELDEVFRAFDPETRKSLQGWFQQQSIGIDGRSRDLSDAFGNAAAFEQDSQRLLKILNGQDRAVRQAVSGTAEVFDAIAERRDALQGLQTNGARATQALADRSEEFAALWRVLPAFELESRRLLARADRFADNADPVISEFRPAWRALAPLARDAGPTAEQLKGLVEGIGAAERASRKGLPAATEFVRQLGPLLREFSPFLAQLEPIVAHFHEYQDNVGLFFANVVAITQAVGPGFGNSPPMHYARVVSALNPETLAMYPNRLPTNRTNPYALPKAQINAQGTGLPVFDERGCGPDVYPRLGSGVVPGAQVPGKVLTEETIARIRKFIFNDDQPTAPPCLLQQRPGGGGRYFQLKPLSPGRG